jgi:DHA1 family tetracycline resistance protein-like MFS transporter
LQPDDRPAPYAGGRRQLLKSRPSEDKPGRSGGADWRKLFSILLIIFTNILGSGVILPILPLYAEGEFGGTILQVTLLSTAYFAAQFVAAPVLGRLSDQHGRRPILMVSQLGTVVAFILFIFAGPLGRIIESWGLPLPITGGMAMLYIARILDGITGGNITTAQAYISDVTAEEDRAHGLGLLQGAFGVGFIFGPAFGGVLANYGPVIPFIGAAIITTGTLLLTTFTLEESLPPEERTSPEARRRYRIALQQVVHEHALLTLLAVSFFVTLAFSALPATFALYADRVLFPDTDPNRVQLYIGLMLTFNGLMSVLTQVRILRPLVVRLGEQRLLIIGTVTLAAAMFAIVPLHTALLVTLLFAPLAFGQGVTQPSLQSLVTRFGARQSGGQLLGLYQSSRSLALIFGPVWAGYAFEAIGPQAVLIVGGVLALIGTLFAILLFRQAVPVHRHQRRQPEGTAGP